MTSPIDHLVYATNDVQDGIEHIEGLLGVRAVAGGSHPGLGTRNAHIALGSRCYLEIIGPDPAQTDFEGIRPFGIDALENSGLVSWAARRGNLTEFVQWAKLKGVELSEVIPMSRVTPQGDRLNWELSFPATSEPIGLIPFFIDWDSTPHPASHSPKGAELLRLQLCHPAPEKIEQIVEALELEVSVCERQLPEIRALIRCPRGEIELS